MFRRCHMILRPHSHMGKDVTVCGRVVKARYAAFDPYLVTCRSCKRTLYFEAKMVLRQRKELTARQ